VGEETILLKDVADPSLMTGYEVVTTLPDFLFESNAAATGC
jgi:hypothetical protein